MRLPVRYAGWMTRDLALGPGIPMAALTALAVLLVTRLEVVGPGGRADQTATLVVLDWTTVALTFLATGGLVSTDFSIGHQRTLFAKPVSPPLYYLQRWLLGSIAVVVGAAVVAATIASRFDVRLLSPAFVGQVLLLYLLVGGLVFLLSTLTRRDWLLAAVVLAWQTLLDAARSWGVARGIIGTALHAMLPPFGLTRLQNPPPSHAEVAYVLAYGTALVLGAVAMLEFRPLARGARQ